MCVDALPGGWHSIGMALCLAEKEDTPMKATGIVRRIDDLGRVVIPKEIRRTQRIREGDPLEIFTTAQGEVIFKKYSPMGEMGQFAAQYTELLHKQFQHTALVCDLDVILAAAGTGRKQYLDKRISVPLERMMQQRQTHLHTGQSGEHFFACEDSSQPVLVACPIVAAGDVSGAVVLLADNMGEKADESMRCAVQLAAGFLARQLED